LRLFLAATALVALATPALAEPWSFEAVEDADGLAGLTAYQWDETIDNVVLGYECDALFGFEALYVQTEEMFEDGADYAAEVPTTFTVDGEAIEITGMFQNRGGYLFTYYDVLDVEGFSDLFDRLVAADDTIGVSLFNKSYSFSAEGAGDALKLAAECL